MTKLGRCPTCKKKLSTSARFCPSCGENNFSGKKMVKKFVLNVKGKQEILLLKNTFLYQFFYLVC